MIPKAAVKAYFRLLAPLEDRFGRAVDESGAFGFFEPGHLWDDHEAECAALCRRVASRFGVDMHALWAACEEYMNRQADCFFGPYRGE